MRGGDNLSIQVSADTSKLRAELARTEKEVRDFTKTLRAATEAGDTKGIEQFSRGLDSASRSVAQIKGELKSHNAVVADSATKWQSLALGIKEAVVAFAGISALRGIANIFGDTAKRITDVSNAAKAAALSPGDVQAFQEVVDETGESADGARQALTQLTDKITEARQKTKELGGTMRDARTAMVNVFRGGEGDSNFGVNIMRGGQKAAKSVDELTKKIIGNAAKFDDNKLSIQSVLQDLAKLRKQDAALGTSVGVQIFGRRYALFAEAIDRLGKGTAWDDVKKELQEQGRLIDEVAEKRVRNYNKAVDDLGDAFEKLKMAIAIPLFPDVTARITDLAKLVENVDQLKAKLDEFKNLSGLAAIEENIAGPVRRGLTSALDAMRTWGEEIGIPLGTPIKLIADLLKITVDIVTGDLSAAFKDFGTMANDTWTALGNLIGWVGGQINEMIEVVKSAIKWVGTLGTKLSAAASAFGSMMSAPGGVLPAPGMARGGTVPGSGSGDTVPAMLTPGEFVVRRSAVRHYGTDMLRSLNAQRYALGGLVDRLHTPVRGFADGGLVSAAADGVTVNLHFPGGSFGLRGDQAIVAGLTREARRAGMRSAGRTPGMAA